MIIKRGSEAGRAPRSGELFIGEHDYQVILKSPQFHVSELTFREGTRTKLHVHTSDQVIALLAAGEPHWHGVRGGGSVTLWSILGPHTTKVA